MKNQNLELAPNLMVGPRNSMEKIEKKHVEKLSF